MVIFTFKAQDKNDHEVEGEVASVSMQQAIKDLEKQGLKVVYLKPKSGFLDNIQAITISTRDRSVMYRQLSTMLKAGISITQAIDICRHTPKKYLAKILGEIQSGLENGYPLSRCMENYPKVFPSVDLGVIRAGEATGKMESVLSELALQSSRTASFVSKVKGALMYPTVILVVLIIAGIVVMTKIIPPIKEIFEQQKSALPPTTSILIGLSDFLVNQWWLFIIIVIILILALYIFSKTIPGRKIFSALQLNFPVLGTLQREVFYARFTRTFAMLMKSGVPIIQSINIAATLTTNVIFLKLLARLAKSIEQGAPITNALSGSKYSPPLMTQMLYVGQQSGDLSGMCQTLADYYEEEVDTKLKSFAALIEPIVLVAVGVAVGFVVISIMQPLYNLTSVYGQ